MKKLCSTLLFLWGYTASFGQPPTIPQLRTQLANARHDTTRIRLCVQLASLYSKSDPVSDSVYTLAMKGIALARQQGKVHQESELYLYLGYYYKRLSQYPKAQAAYQTGLQIGEKTGISTIRCKLLHRLAAVYGDQGMYQKTIETALASLQMAEQLKDSVRMSHAMQLLSAAHMDVHNSTAAFLYAKKLNQLTRQLAVTHPDQQGLVLMGEETMAELYERTGHYSRAYPYLKQSLAYYIAQHDEPQIAEAAVHLGNNLINQKQPLAAIKHISESLRKKLIPYPVSDTHEIYALAHQQLGHPDSAVVYARKAHQLALKKGQLKQIQSTLGTLVRMEEDQKLYPTALAHLRQLNTINDSIFTIDKAKAIADVETQYQVLQKEQTIDLLQKDAALRKLSLAKNQSELANQHQRQIFLTLFTVLLILGLAGLYISYRRQQITSQLLTDQKEEIQEKAEQLQQLNSLKDNLFSIIGHDLRSPLAALKVKLVDLADKQVILTPTQPDYLRMLKLTDKVYNTTDNLLSWSLLQRGGMHKWPTTFDLSEIGESAHQLFSYQLQQKQLTLTTAYSPAPVTADENQLQIVARNLLHNAIKFTPEGGHVHLSTGQEQGCSVLIIQDSGIGMSSGDYAETADLHSRPHSANSGTGLGLTICREFVKLNNGELRIQSALGKGTTVTVFLENTPLTC
ncbi:ATP-binding protein [Fibrella aquatica]|jgi:signal transduction histidine kinase|uniref:ATP-binding protein n=1 Tax=Fibrella aquatica TaxID=3242487 RepID=UPI0035208CED